MRLINTCSVLSLVAFASSVVLAQDPVKVAGYIVAGGWSKTWLEHMLYHERLRLTLEGNSQAEVARRMRLFAELHASGQTIVMITHDQAVARLASRVVQIRDGLVVEDRPAAA